MTFLKYKHQITGFLTDTARTTQPACQHEIMKKWSYLDGISSCLLLSCSRYCPVIRQFRHQQSINGIVIATIAALMAENKSDRRNKDKPHGIAFLHWRHLLSKGSKEKWMKWDAEHFCNSSSSIISSRNSCPKSRSSRFNMFYS